MPDGGRSLSAAERALGLAEARALVAWNFDNASVFDDLPGSIHRCDTEPGAHHMIRAHLKVMLPIAYRTSGETDKLAPLVVDGSWWMRRSASPGGQFVVALYLAQAIALVPTVDPNSEPLLVLEELLMPDAQRTLPVFNQVPGLIALAEIQLRLGD